MARLLTVAEVSDYLQLNPRTVLKMAQSGELPAAKMARQWRFRPEWLERWLDQQATPQGAPRPRPSETRSELALAGALFTNPDLLALRAKDRLGALREIADALVREGRLPALEPFLQTLYEREALLSTGLGNGVAVPHPRRVMPGLCPEPTVVLARSETGIDWSAIDGRPVHLVFLLMSPSDRAHLRWLSTLSRVLTRPGVVEGLRSAVSRDAAADLLGSAERTLGAA